jgi:toxin secretion/phage lysis holin
MQRIVKEGGGKVETIINNIQFTSVVWAILAPMILIVLDVLTGVMIAWRNNDFQSAKMRAGLSKKFGELVYILVGILTKYALGTDLVLYFAVGYICLMEISSLAENCDKLGVKVPDKLKEKLNNKKEE